MAVVVVDLPAALSLGGMRWLPSPRSPVLEQDPVLCEGLSLLTGLVDSIETCSGRSRANWRPVAWREAWSWDGASQVFVELEKMEKRMGKGRGRVSASRGEKAWTSQELENAGAKGRLLVSR